MTPQYNNVRLRAMEPEDLELIYRIENDPDYWRHGSSTVPYSRYALRQYISSAQNDLFADRQVRLVVACGELPVGLADLANFDASHLRAEVGLALLPEHQGHRCGQAALRLLGDYARRLGLHQLYAVVAVANLPAARAFGRAGFEATALLRQWLRQDEAFVDARLWQLMLRG